MSWATFDHYIKFLPQVEKPQEKKLQIKTKLKWTALILLAYFILKHIPLIGLSDNKLSEFNQLSMILGTDFGSVISLGIGPIVTASIVLQLVNGSGLYKFDMTSHTGKMRFQGVQRLLTIFFIVFEAGIYVFLGGLAPDPMLRGTQLFLLLELILIAQLIVGGLMIMIMDDLSTKWGIGSGVSLFIAGGVSEGLFIRLFSPLRSDTGEFVGAIPGIFQSLAMGDMTYMYILLGGIIATLVVFVMAVYAQSMKVEIPLSFGRVRGHGIRWPLNFMYTSVLPIILISALLANIQLGAVLLSGRFNWNPEVITAWVNPQNLVGAMITNQTIFIGWLPYAQMLTYAVILITGAIVFSYFWMQTSGMDARSQAKQIMQAGLQIPGFRRDPRVMEHLLNRYIVPLTIMGGALIGILAVVADVLGALTAGTGILLVVMIIYKFYEDIARKHITEMNPMMRRLMGK